MKTPKKFKTCRRLRTPIYEKCQTQKFIISQAKKSKNLKKEKPLSEFGHQLLEKQKIRLSYGINEKQFKNYVKKAMGSTKKESPQKLLAEFLESRLDNVIYRLGIAPTRRAARQMVSHGHFLVNGKKTRIPSFQIKINDLISIREGSKKKEIFKNLDKKIKNVIIPSWLSFDFNKMEAKVVGKPPLVPEFDYGIVLEFYSR